MKMICLALSALILSYSLSAQQDNIAVRYGEQISTSELKEYLTIIASDALEGRRTGSRGQAMAAAFISTHFQEIGLAAPVNGSYFQQVPLFSVSEGESKVVAGSLDYGSSDFIYLGLEHKSLKMGQIVFAGDGSSIAIEKLDLANKVALIWSEKRLADIDLSPLKEKGVYFVFVCNSKDDEAFRNFAGTAKRFLNSSRVSLSRPISATDSEMIAFVSPSATSKIMGLPIDRLAEYCRDEKKMLQLRKLKPVEVSFDFRNHIKEIASPNVMGYLEGTDRKDELIVVTAHYDHIGKREGSGDTINNGADDDGSGTVAVMELAKVFAQAKRDGRGPRRSMLFMTVTAEEVGLLGSQYYTSNPIFPLNTTMVNLNIDMIGRTDPEHKDRNDYVYVIGSDKLSQELHQLSERVNTTYTQLDFDYTYNDVNHSTNLYKRSDHWNFAKNNIPIIFYFDGIHEDYHQPSDEVDKIEFDLLAKRTKLVFYTAWELANRDKTIKPD